MHFLTISFNPFFYVALNIFSLWFYSLYEKVSCNDLHKSKPHIKFSYMNESQKHIDLKSRGSGINTKNRFEQLDIDYDLSSFDEYFDQDPELVRIKTKFYNDNSKSILAKKG